MKILIVLALPFVLGACSLVQGPIDFATEKGSRAVAEGVNAQCKLSKETRARTYQLYLGEQAKVNPNVKILPFDCDGDGVADDL